MAEGKSISAPQDIWDMADRNRRTRGFRTFSKYIQHLIIQDNETPQGSNDNDSDSADAVRPEFW